MHIIIHRPKNRAVADRPLAHYRCIIKLDHGRARAEPTDWFPWPETVPDHLRFLWRGGWFITRFWVRQVGPKER